MRPTFTKSKLQFKNVVAKIKTKGPCVEAKKAEREDLKTSRLPHVAWELRGKRIVIFSEKKILCIIIKLHTKRYIF